MQVAGKTLLLRAEGDGGDENSHNQHGGDFEPGFVELGRVGRIESLGAGCSHNRLLIGRIASFSQRTFCVNRCVLSRLEEGPGLEYTRIENPGILD